MSTVAAMPADADPHAELPFRYLGTDGVDDSHNFMTGYAWKLYAGKSPGHREHVAVAHPACLHFDAYLARLGVRDVTLHDFESGIGFPNLNDFHSRHEKILFASTPLVGIRGKTAGAREA